MRRVAAVENLEPSCLIHRSEQIDFEFNRYSEIPGVDKDIEYCRMYGFMPAEGFGDCEVVELSDKIVVAFVEVHFIVCKQVSFNVIEKLGRLGVSESFNIKLFKSVFFS